MRGVLNHDIKRLYPAENQVVLVPIVHLDGRPSDASRPAKLPAPFRGDRAYLKKDIGVFMELRTW
jgi:hypothetical protein